MINRLEPLKIPDHDDIIFDPIFTKPEETGPDKNITSLTKRQMTVKNENLFSMMQQSASREKF